MEETKEAHWSERKKTSCIELSKLLIEKINNINEVLNQYYKTGKTSS